MWQYMTVRMPCSHCGCRNRAGSIDSAASLLVFFTQGHPARSSVSLGLNGQCWLNIGCTADSQHATAGTAVEPARQPLSASAAGRLKQKPTQNHLLWCVRCRKMILEVVLTQDGILTVLPADMISPVWLCTALYYSTAAETQCKVL